MHVFSLPFINKSHSYIKPDMPERFFVNPTAPLPKLAADWLFPRLWDIRSGGFSDVAVVLPTRSAARTLRNMLAEKFAARGERVLEGFKISTPEILISDLLRNVKIANRYESCSAWLKALSGTDSDTWSAIFPGGSLSGDCFMKFSGVLSALLSTLAEAGLRAADIASGRLLPGDFDRWRAVAKIEASYIRNLEPLIPPENAILKAVEIVSGEGSGNAVLPKRVFILGVPDPSPLFIRVLSSFHACEVCSVIFADASQADMFDDWGVPNIKWTECSLPYPETSVCADLQEQAEMIACALEHYGAEAARACSIACGEADSLKRLMSLLDFKGIDSYTPRGEPISKMPEFAFLRDMCDYMKNPSADSLMRMLRNPRALSALSRQTSFSADDILAQLDALRRDSRFDSLLSAMDLSLSDLYAHKYPAAGAALEVLFRLFAERAPARFLEGILDFIFEGKGRSEVDLAGSPFHESATRFAGELLRDLTLAGESGFRASREDILEIAASEAEQRFIPMQKGAESIALVDWIEVVWSLQPHVILADMNEGIVPQAKAQDSFLPDGARAALGMRNSVLRRARDAYMLYALVKSREAGGKVSALVPRSRGKGEPSQASGLLMQCSGQDLPKRVLELFEHCENTSENIPFEASWKLKIPFGELPSSLSPSAFKSYLECPFRFYLRYVLRAETFDASSPDFDPLEAGTLVHAALEDFSRSQCASSGDIRAFREALLESFDKCAMRACGGDLSAALRFQFASLKDRLSDAAEGLAALRADGWETLEIEKPMDNLDICGFKIRMRVDRIDRNPDGDILIIDYKLKDKKVSAEDAHKKKIGRSGDFEWRDLQLPIYKMAVEKIYPGARIICAHFIIGRQAEESGASIWDISEADMSSARGEAARICEAIRLRKFEPADTKVHKGFDPYGGLFSFAPSDLGNFLEWEKR